MKAWIAPLITRKNLDDDLIVSLLIAAGFSAFIYFAHWGIEFTFLNSVAGIAAIWGLMSCRKRALVLSGFFIGLLWFYWIGFSFRYYDMAYAVPFVALGFGLVYALTFGVMAFTDKPYLRATILFAITYFEPFDFNWMVPELLFIHSWFGVEKWQFGLILAAVALFASVKHPWRYLSVLLLLGAVEYTPATEKPLPPLSIKLVTGALPQEEKWVPANRERIVAENFGLIKQAITEEYDMVVLHESAFPLFLNRRPDLLAHLTALSDRITIVTGALFYEEERNYNVTYLFHNGRMQIAKKMVLVPFGEYIPLPDFLHTFINDIFFDGAPDYVNATEPTTFDVDGMPFRNAVCYEATCPELYEGAPPYMIAISNNAWFAPSIEPTLQRLLMEFYAKKHGTVIFHAANMGGTGVIR